MSQSVPRCMLLESLDCKGYKWRSEVKAPPDQYKQQYAHIEADDGARPQAKEKARVFSRCKRIGASVSLVICTTSGDMAPRRRGESYSPAREMGGDVQRLYRDPNIQRSKSRGPCFICRRARNRAGMGRRERKRASISICVRVIRFRLTTATCRT